MGKNKIKTYRHTTMVFATHIVVVGEKEVNITFQFGVKYPKLVCGYLTTDDPKLQKAIESSKYFGRDKEFYLEKVNGEYVNPETLDNTKEKKLEAAVDELTQEVANITELYNKEAIVVEQQKQTISNLTTQLEEKKELITVLEDELSKVKNKGSDSTTSTLNEGTDNNSVVKVKNLQEVKELLKKEPYSVPANKMPNETAIVNKATEVGLKYEITEDTGS